MKRRNGRIVFTALVLMACFSLVPAGSQSHSQLSSVEVAFVLDSTGSMGGLIDGAKRKIWSIANSVVELQLAPQGRIGLISYRDRGDQYITQFYDLTDDLDAVFRRLQSFTAAGGGDGPESVNQALNEAVRLMSWTPQQDVLKIIFLVGDAPPHMDYRDDVHYPQSCSEAVQKGLIINTIQCGNNAQTRRVWQEIARLGEGAYVALAQSGGNMAIVDTPYDEEILRLTAELNRTVVVYGSRELQELTRGKLAAAQEAPAGVAADRAAFNLASGGKVVQGRGDLVADWRSGLVAPDQLDPDALPQAMRSMSSLQREQYLEKMQARRDTLNFQLADLNGDRAAFLDREKRRLTASGGGDAFDAKVTEMLAEQATRVRSR
ncbi:MAG: VWA domain-containing protein [Spirochaetales bacterium]|nr:VWA domain-containing protein [Spirochaetales bacterium]